MRDIWLLPDREQTGTIQVFESGELKPLHEAVELSLLPMSFVLGIPEAVLRENPSEGFVFSQYSRLSDNRAVFAVSKRAGLDQSGRSVVLTNLQWLEPEEHPVLPKGQTLEIFDKLRKSKEIIEFALDDNALENVRAMLYAVDSRPSIRSYASESMARSANRPEWSPRRKKHLASPFRG